MKPLSNNFDRTVVATLTKSRSEVGIPGSDKAAVLILFWMRRGVLLVNVILLTSALKVNKTIDVFARFQSVEKKFQVQSQEHMVSQKTQFSIPFGVVLSTYTAG